VCLLQVLVVVGGERAIRLNWVECVLQRIVKRIFLMLPSRTLGATAIALMRFTFRIDVNVSFFRTREEAVPHCSESHRCALLVEQTALVRLMWQELLRLRDDSRRN
jgi:hypothetical protein